MLVLEPILLMVQMLMSDVVDFWNEEPTLISYWYLEDTSKSTIIFWVDWINFDVIDKDLCVMLIMMEYLVLKEWICIWIFSSHFQINYPLNGLIKLWCCWEILICYALYDEMFRIEKMDKQFCMNLLKYNFFLKDLKYNL